MLNHDIQHLLLLWRQCHVNCSRSCRFYSFAASTTGLAAGAAFTVSAVGAFFTTGCAAAGFAATAAPFQALLQF
ncbi:hypothetical protein JCM19237_3592 [Photobacterium aphoticum]|uniref:Uncharacterized protein n=1 Tax=Photobacterium aphoticum TaxID=754436 RepID=A0A090QTN4_9GAMM|nr:hypothetical protein JCM19237_3592 [Photobacterium aphoticum]